MSTLQIYKQRKKTPNTLGLRYIGVSDNKVFTKPQADRYQRIYHNG